MSINITASVIDALGATATVVATATQSVPVTSIPYPNTANRPHVVSASMNYLGPAAGGSSTVNDTMQTHPLTASTGVTTSAAGQTIIGLDCSGPITVNHNNTYIRICRIKMSGQTQAIAVKDGVTGTIIEDCEIDGQMALYNGIRGYTSPWAYTATIRRCYIHGMENGITGNNINSLIEENLIGPLGNTGSSTCDADGIELYGNSANNTIRHNTFDNTNSQTTKIGTNSCLNLTNSGGTVTNNTVTDNHFIGATEFAEKICDDNSQGGGSLTWSCTNNGFINIGNKAFRLGRSTPSPNSGNYTTTDPTAPSGTLCNGTGVI